MPRRGVAVSSYNCMFIFFKNLHGVLPSSCTISLSQQACRRVPYFHTLSNLFLEMFRDGQTHQCKGTLTGLLIGLSLTISNAEHLSMCLMAICMPSWKKYPFCSLAHWFVGLFVFLILSYKGCFYVLDTNSLWVSLKSRDITLPTKVRLVKGMVFPVVMYGCESWMWRRLSAEELMLLNCGVGEDSWESLGLQGDPTSPFWRSALGFLWKEWC